MASSVLQSSRQAWATGDLVSKECSKRGRIGGEGRGKMEGGDTREERKEERMAGEEKKVLHVPA